MAGLHGAEAERRELTPDQIEHIVRTEITDRRDAANTYRRAGRDDLVAELRREADALSSILDKTN